MLLSDVFFLIWYSNDFLSQRKIYNIEKGEII